MSFFKTDFTRFFALGFLAGTALIVGTMNLQGAQNISDSIVPAANAAVSH